MINSRIVAEISRTGNVVSDTLNQLKLISLVPIYMTVFPQDIVRKFPQIAANIENLFNLEKKIRDKYIDENGKKGKMERFQRRFEDDPLYEEYRDKVSVVVGYLQNHPDIVEALMNSHASNEQGRKFCKVVKRYEMIVRNKLRTTNEERDMFKDQRNDLKLKEKKLRTDEKSLEKKLQIERKKRRMENSALDHDLKRLGGEISDFVREFKAGKTRYDFQLREKELAISTHFEKVKVQLVNDIKSTRDKVNELRKENFRKERVERGEVMNKESEAVSSINKYDEFMIDSTTEIESFKDSYEINSHRIKELGKGIEELREHKTNWEKQKKAERKVFLMHIRKMQSVAVAKVAMVETWRKYRDKHFPKKKKSRGGKRRKGKGKGKGKKKGGKKKKKKGRN